MGPAFVPATATNMTLPHKGIIIVSSRIFCAAVYVTNVSFTAVTVNGYVASLCGILLLVASWASYTMSVTAHASLLYLATGLPSL